jgi:hypothetical protein
MSEDIINENAETQESVSDATPVAEETTTASTNEPAQDTAIDNLAAQLIAIAEETSAHEDFDWTIDNRNVSRY